MDHDRRLLSFLATTATAVVFMYPAICCAEPILIVEMHNTGQLNLGSGEPEMGFQFRVGPSSEWSILATQTNVGQTFSAPVNLLSIYSQRLTSPETVFVVMTCCGATDHGFVSPPRLNEGNTGGDFVTVTRIAPNLGPNLVGYRLTDVTQTIDDITITHVSDNRFNRSGAHTVRIYGEVIPEPKTLLLVVTNVLFCCQLRVRGASGKLRPIAF